jgi:hypothetical protein
MENADKCAWQYGEMSTNAQGKVFNVVLGGKPYLLQQNWIIDDDAGGYCGMETR